MPWENCRLRFPTNSYHLSTVELGLKGVLCTCLGSKRPLGKALFVLTEVWWLCHAYELLCVLQCLSPAIVPYFFLCLVGNKLRDREVDELFSDVGEYHGFIHTAGICLVSNRGGLGTSKFSEALWRGGGKRKENLQQRLWDLNSASNSLVAPLRRSSQISANQREVETSANKN